MAEIATAAGSKAAEKVTETVLKKARIIVIVDNIWKKLDLKVVGIPFSYDDKGTIQQDKKESNDEQMPMAQEVFVKEMYKDSIAICLHHGDIDGLPERVVLPRLENLNLSSINIENIWFDQPQPMSSYMQCLKSLTLEDCNGLKSIFSSSMVKSLMQLKNLVICNFSIATGLLQLKELWISSCGLEEIVAKEEVDGAPSLDLSEKLTTSQATEPPSPASLILALSVTSGRMASTRFMIWRVHLLRFLSNHCKH
ncbi:hypothetical protein Patl1_07076 [Pistacia atlantica]|uniref:Uncharacterized protein n=1 Tax=Pistacia atlantica TaxID=434234 RepID=A0ACC1AJR7_9ROSI|nr:hypothetical protein Patl1_07076 [Pistacia atlantica]